jgi:hypothetical protein
LQNRPPSTGQHPATLSSSWRKHRAKLRSTPFFAFKLNENQLALEAPSWNSRTGSSSGGATDIAENVRGALEAIDKNEEFIKMTLAVLMTPE